jgi:hypothetical protein
MAITRLQNQDIVLIEAIQIIEDVSVKFNNLKGQIGIKINEKLQTVLTKNKGFKIVRNISKILNGEENVGYLDIPEDLTTVAQQPGRMAIPSIEALRLKGAPSYS